MHGADVLVVAPTGMGKRYVISISIAVGWHRKLIYLRSFGVGSLCFQVPAVADAHGITIVISPLLCKLCCPGYESHTMLIPRSGTMYGYA